MELVVRELKQENREVSERRERNEERDMRISEQKEIMDKYGEY